MAASKCWPDVVSPSPVTAPIALRNVPNAQNTNNIIEFRIIFYCAVAYVPSSFPSIFTKKINYVWSFCFPATVNLLIACFASIAVSHSNSIYSYSVWHQHCFLLCASLNIICLCWPRMLSFSLSPLLEHRPRPFTNHSKLNSDGHVFGCSHTHSRLFIIHVHFG